MGDLGIVMMNSTVPSSRAGDAFHYRWAARRCLKLIPFNAFLKRVVIESSLESELPGELVIDIAEYYGLDVNNFNCIHYIQLKHSTQKTNPFTLSELQNTISGFAKRFSVFKASSDQKETKIVFKIVSNREISLNIKNAFYAISIGSKINTKTIRRIKEITNLDSKKLENFSKSLYFEDEEGDYLLQRDALKKETTEFLASTPDNPLIDSLITMISDAVLPDKRKKNEHIISRETVLVRFGSVSLYDLFPAPPQYEKINNLIQRKQYKIILESVFTTSTPIMIHAAGGVGKSIFANYCINSLPYQSFGVLYDCFGGGKYRNLSEPRHRHRDALVQIINELAVEGLCPPFILQNTDDNSKIIRKFLASLSKAICAIRSVNDRAILLIIIDAADNAVMAANEKKEQCFVHDVFRETFPDGCKFIILSRTERINLLNLPDDIKQINLEPFNEEESFLHLKQYFPEASLSNGAEFHRLTNTGNPRVQASALTNNYSCVDELLQSFGPSGISLDDQIAEQINNGIKQINKKSTKEIREQIKLLCYALGNLPPVIPIEVLSAVTGIDKETIHSFLSDIGRPLWLTDNSVQFRDEPTETWFRKTYVADDSLLLTFLKNLKSVTLSHSYAAKTLPFLLLKTEQYDELIDLALSDEYLPENNPIEQRSIRLARLQLAFTASLKRKNYKYAIKIALRTGEETAGDQRQQELLLQNTDLFALFETESRIHEIALRHSVHNEWKGSSAIYSASLLSFYNKYKGEALSFLRLAEHWIKITLERDRDEENTNEKTVETEDLVELVYVYFNVSNIEKAGEFILRWGPERNLYYITKIFVKRLLDRNLCDDVYKLLSLKNNKLYIVLAIIHELYKIGQLPAASIVKKYFNKLKKKDHDFSQVDTYLKRNDDIVEAFITFLEISFYYNLPVSDIKQQILRYFPFGIAWQIKDKYYINERYLYMRAVALLSKVNGNQVPEMNYITPKYWHEAGKKEHDSDIKQVKNIIVALLPLYVFRFETIFSGVVDKEKYKNVFKSNSADYQMSEIKNNDYQKIFSDLLIFCKDENTLKTFYELYLKNQSTFFIQHDFSLLYAANRCVHLFFIRKDIEVKILDFIKNDSDESSEDKANTYIRLARAVLPLCKDDAIAYFNEAINEVSRFGDEIVSRWDAISALGDRTADGRYEDEELAYRFIRCAEIVGNTVAREKYWDRNNAIFILGRLSPTTALAVLSRWRDRDIGWFPKQLKALASSLLENRYINSLQAWALNPFFENDEILSFSLLCLKYAQLRNVQQYIINSSYDIFRKSDGDKIDWKEFKSKVESLGHKIVDIDEIIQYYDQRKLSDNYEYINTRNKQYDIDWDSVFSKIDFTNPLSFYGTFEQFITANKYSDRDIFINEALFRIADKDRITFSKQLLLNESLHYFDILTFIDNIPEDWFKSISFQKYYPTFIKDIAHRYALILCNRHYLKDFIEKTKTKNGIDIYQAIHEGLSEYPEILSSEEYFGYAEFAVQLINTENAKELLDFALLRMEKHIPEDFGDGLWDTWLIPPKDIDMAFAGLIWGALSSPRMKMRWKATHSVRFIAEASCQNTIDALIKWLEIDKIEAFGCKRYPFYNLHARLYLLIAFARISIEKSLILKDYSVVFSNHALFDIPHILIQKFAADIAIRIENDFPDTYKKEVFSQLLNVGKSRFPAKKLDIYKTKVNSYLHKTKKYKDEEKYFHGLDFDQYWFEPLGRLFGISEKQINDLATEIIVSDWKVETDGSYNSEPRDIFRRYSHNDETQHSHGSHPQAEGYNFYLSYHALFVVASNLLSNMPLIYGSYGRKFEDWEDWLHHHTLTQYNGKWLSDRRDHVPLLSYISYSTIDVKNWHKEYRESEFLDRIFLRKDNESWINICTSWEENYQGLRERVHIVSALVSPETSLSLLYAWNSYDNPHDFRLPMFQEKEFEKKLNPFVLKGYIIDEYESLGIDRHDPFAEAFDYPAFQIGESFTKNLGLLPDTDSRFWYEPQNDIPVMECKIWNSGIEEHSEITKSKGKYLSVSFNILKKLCLKTRMDIIFEVIIERKKERQEENEDYGKEKKRQTRLYLFSADGKFRDAGTCYKYR